VAVALILLQHTPASINHNPLRHLPLFYDFVYNNGVQFLTYYVSPGPIGVYLLVFISGAVLYRSYAKKKDQPYKKFVWVRAQRLYPAYWLALALCALITPEFILNGAYFIPQLTGFLPSAMYFQWWIGLFMSLYLVFPLLKRALDANPNLTLLSAFVLTILSRLLIPSDNFAFLGFPDGATFLDRVLLPCLIFEFTLGMYVMKKQLYPKMMYAHSVGFFLADISYYVFLTHQFVRFYLDSHNPASFWETSSLVAYASTVLVVAVVFMHADTQIQKWLSRLEPRIRRYRG